MDYIRWRGIMRRLLSKTGRVVGLALSPNKGDIKHKVSDLELIEGYGVVGDAHSGTFKEVSLLSIEDRDRVASRELLPGESAENILIEGIPSFYTLYIGDRIKIGRWVILEVVQIGKECEEDSFVHKYTGSCILPEVGIFCRVIVGGKIFIGDEVKILGKVGY